MCERPISNLIILEAGLGVYWHVECARVHHPLFGVPGLYLGGVKTSSFVANKTSRIYGIQYIGETKNSLKKRFYGHRSTVKTQKLDTPVGQHFNLYPITPFLT